MMQTGQVLELQGSICCSICLYPVSAMETYFCIFIPVPAIIFAVLYVAYSIWAGKRGNTHINHSAHLWGAAYGVIVTILIEPRVIPHFLDQLTRLPF